jgi:hypothetical protein
MGMVLLVSWPVATFPSQHCYNFSGDAGLDAFTGTKQSELREEPLARSAGGARNLRARDQFDHPHLPLYDSAPDRG